MQRPELSVVIPTLANYGVLRRALDRYEAQDAPAGSFEMLVVADAADPEPGAVDEAIGERRYPVRRLTGHTPGVSANRNAGWRAAEAPLVLFTDDDILPRSQLVAEHLAWHRAHPAEEVSVLGHVRWAREVHVSGFMHWLDFGIQFDYPNIDGIEAGWGRFYSSNVSLKRGLIERVGGFDDERLPYGYEDLDFGYRASKLGLRLLYNRQAVAEHLRKVDLSFWKKRASRVAITEREFVSKHPEIEPYFFPMFRHAAKLPVARGRGRHLIRYVPRSFPWLGEKVWTSADLYFRQQLAPYFLEAWEEAEAESPSGTRRMVAPRLLEREPVNPRASRTTQSS